MEVIQQQGHEHVLVFCLYTLTPRYVVVIDTASKINRPDYLKGFYAVGYSSLLIIALDTTYYIVS